MSAVSGWDRRRAARCAFVPGAAVGRLRLVGADEVDLLEASPFGAVFDSWTRVRPGQWVRCAWQSHALSGRVLRCWVSQIADGRGVRYRAAMLFEPPAPPGAFLHVPEADAQREVGSR